MSDTMNYTVMDTVNAQLKATVVGGSGGGSGGIVEYIESCDINEAGELIFVTNTGRYLNAGKIPIPSFDDMTDEEKQNLVNELIQYITNNGDSKTVQQFFDELTEKLVQYITEGDNQTIQKFFEELVDQTVQYITENGDTINLGASVFVVTFTETDGTYKADKKFSEVMAEIEDGNVVVAEFGTSTNKGILQLNGYGSGLIEFVYHSYWGADSYLCLKSDETVEYVVQSVVADEEMPSSVRVTKNDDTVTVTALKGWGESVTTIALDDNGYPVGVTKDGKECTLTWEGFE